MAVEVQQQVQASPDGSAPAGSTGKSDEAVRDTLRFGWALAELRGRYRLGPSHVALPQKGAVRSYHALPLAQERSEVEQKLEVVNVVGGLATSLKLDFTVRREHANGRERFITVEADGTSVSSELKTLVRLIDGELAAQPDGDVTETKNWNLLTDLIWKWDAHTQDALALRPAEAAAYQAGRGLAEAYWALDPNAEGPDDWTSWEFLLGDQRRTFLKRQTSRLTSHLDPLTPTAIAGSLDTWGEVAASEGWRQQSDARPLLYEQTLLWRDLLRGERDPRDLLSEHRTPWHKSISWPLVKSFLPQLLFAILSLAILAIGIVALAKGPSNPTLAFLGTLLGSLGVTSASLYARVKSTLQTVVDSARTAYVRDLIGTAAAIVPKPPISVASRRKLRL